MPVPMPASRGENSQGYNFYGYEQSMSKGQGNKSHERRGGKTGHSGISNESSGS